MMRGRGEEEGISRKREKEEERRRWVEEEGEVRMSGVAEKRREGEE